MPDDIIRISCAALCRIEIGDRFLLEINKNRGDVLTPIGGALEFHEEARTFLESIGAVFQKGRDLRLVIPTSGLPAFREWFSRKEHRETDPLRELREELIEEHGILPEWPAEEPVISFLRMVELEEATTRKDQAGMLTHYFYEIFSARLPAAVESACVSAASRPHGTLHLLSRGEMAAARSHGALLVAETSRIVIDS
jgi:hypothetical protein